MSSSGHNNPLEDITNGKKPDPKEIKRQRDRERYAKNKDEILRRRRESRELKKQTTTLVTDENTLCDTPATRQSGITQVQYITPTSGVAPDVQQSYASHIRETNSSQLHAGLTLVGAEDQSKDPKEVKRQRDRERYAKNKDEILKRRRQSRELKKQSSALLNDENTLGDTGATRQSGVTQRQYRTSAPGVTPIVHSGVNCLGLSQTSAPFLHSSERTPLSNVINTRTNGIEEIANGSSSMSRDLHTSCIESMLPVDDDSDWLHRNDTYMRDMRSLEELQNGPTSLRLHEQDSFIKRSTYEEKKRLCDSSKQTRQLKRERYSLMTDEQRDIRLQKNCEYKRCIRENRIMGDRDGNVTASTSTPIVQPQPYKNQCTGDINNEEDSDPTGIFEPSEHGAYLQENLDNIQDDQTMHDDDEECRIFSGLGDVFDSYRETSDVPSRKQNDDPYDSIYHNLPSKHHVLKPVPDCVHCGAMRFQYEGPAFCCRKGKVKIATPEVPQELRRLFTSQDDEDAKYFRKHIRYFNSHFSFTSLGVTLDQRVSNAAGSGVYTFRAQGALYYKMDNLVPGGQGPRHLQLYIYHTDETMEHRVKRSPDLDINLIRTILEILKNNPYVQIFKSIGSVPNLAEYRILLNTDIRLDQRRYNAPTASQVAALWVEGSDPENTFDRQVVVYGKGERPLFIRAYYGCYDPLAYPLFFPGGETGWNRSMPYDEPAEVVEANHQDVNHGGDLQDLDRTSNVHVEHNTNMLQETRRMMKLESLENLSAQGSTTVSKYSAGKNFLTLYCLVDVRFNNGLLTCTSRWKQ